MFNGYFDVVLAEQDLTRATPWYAGITRGPALAGIVVLLAGGLLLWRRLR